jgi:hypothetical protein
MKSFKIPSLKTFMVWALLLPLVGGWGAACTSTNPEPSLPPETQEGRNTFGCLINGKVWIPDFGGAGDIYNTPLTIAKYDPFRQGQFSIGAKNYSNYNNDHDKLSFLIWGTPISGQTYEFKSLDTLYFNQVKIDFSRAKANPVCSDSKEVIFFKGKLYISKFDLTKRIAAGTFEFMLKSKNCTDTLKVTQGRFDMTF